MLLRFRKHVPVLLAVLLFMLFLGGCTDSAWEKHIVKEQVFLPGLEGEYDFLFLTDSHVICISGQESEKEKESAQERKGHFTKESGADPAKQFEKWLDYTNENRFDVVLLGGDIVDSPAEGNIAFLEKELAGLKIPYLYTPGNHDWTQPWEYMTQKAKEEYLPRLKPYMNDNPAIQKLDIGELRIIAVNNSSNQVEESILPLYEQYLQTEKKVILLIHVPLLTQSVLSHAKEVWDAPVVLGGGNYGGIYPDESSMEFLKLTVSEDSRVELVLAGHVHFHDRDNIDGEKKVLQIVGPAGYEGKAVHLKITGKQQTE